MSNSTSLIPSSIPLSGGASINSILSDIPLFCQGIMGMGVFTFLFINRRVKVMSVFLYGSSFLAFAAATLDLGQILARSPDNVTVDISLESIVGLLFAREIFLALSLSFLNIFFWMLVADCPKEERINTSMDTMSALSRESLHSASWSRWGAVGTILKWGSLVALLSAPLLQVLWRLLVSQRRYSTLYVAESILQTSISLIFILKLFLNIYLSTLPNWWDAFRPYIPAFMALAIGTSLGVGNLILFAFAESPLGRFLQAVEVYILIILSLHTTFVAMRRNIDNTSPQSPINNIFAPEKSPGLPIAVRSSYNNQMLEKSENIFVPRKMNSPRRQSLRIAIVSSPTTRTTIDIAEPANRTYEQPTSSNVVFDFPAPSSRRSSTSAISTQRFQERIVRSSPSLRQSLDMSYYSDPKNGDAQSTMETVKDNLTVMGVSKAPSMTSFDELVRQANEMDHSIEALRLEVTQSRVVSVGNYSIAEEPSQSIIRQSSLARTESISGRSEFSLSVFPDPPAVPSNEMATKYVVVDSAAYTDNQHSRNQSSASANVAVSRGKLGSIGELDVTSFIGGATEDSKRENMLSDADNTSSEGGKTTNSAPTAVIGSAVALRPMILTSALLLSPTDRESQPLSATTYSNMSPSNSDSSTNTLKPLFLGRPISSIVTPTKIGTVIPLAQRRLRVSNSRFPAVISHPRMRNDPTMMISNPRAFESPRPPPLRST